MTQQARLRRIGWFALLALCTALYGVLHFQVWSVASDVKRTERQIVALEQTNMLLETEFLTRSSQVQLAAWNRVDFGYGAPEAGQFIDNERQLAQFSSRPHDDAPQLHLAGYSEEDAEAPPFPRLVSPITGKPVDVALIEPAHANSDNRTTLAARLTGGSARVPMGGPDESGPATVRIALGGGSQ
jgi:hypothetical protein